MSLSLKLPNGSIKTVSSNTTCLEVAKEISSSLAKKALLARLNDNFLSLEQEIEQAGDFAILTWEDSEAREAYRHTASHILAQAVKRLYPDVKLAIGPAIENGFYYDFDNNATFSTDDLLELEKEMASIIKEDLPITSFTLPRAEAIELMRSKGEDYKIELINDLPEDVELSFYTQGEFTDLCAGPHLARTSRVKAFKLTHLAGAYWRGNEKNKMLQRIYGTAFESKADLDSYLQALEEARKRDHRRLGKELDLFTIDDYVGAGLVLWHPKLSAVREQIEIYWRKEHRKRGYEYVYTPNIGRSQLWETSGHLRTYSDAMYPPMQMEIKDIEEQDSYYVKPMSCPFHIRVYKAKPRSYRDLPLRWCELGNVYRFERSGALHGMLRVRGFTQDDAHLICTEEQFEDELNGILDFAIDINRVFGFDQLKVYLSVRDLENKDAKYVGNEETWNRAESTLERLLIERGVSITRDVGGAKFYGPAIDLKAVDAMGREWQGTTIQLDMNLPTLFNMTYIGSDGQEHVPVMLHRTLLGSMERFVGTLIEQYAGAFPTWLAPVQVEVLTITSRSDERAKEIVATYIDDDIRAHADMRNEKIGYKIREAQVSKVPYMLIIGDKELEDGMVSVRSGLGGDLGRMTLEEFNAKLYEEIRTKALRTK